ncbi:MAG: hypothetical protein IKE38_04545 [Erysipelotrichaceae bacterium]|nr:hypothetical protein [Erysipelotrichaceae bacterium]
MKAVIYFVIMAGIYALAYIFNHRTKKPEGCEDLRKDCAGCRIVYCPANAVYEGGKDHD